MPVHVDLHSQVLQEAENKEHYRPPTMTVMMLACRVFLAVFDFWLGYWQKMIWQQQQWLLASLGGLNLSYSFLTACSHPLSLPVFSLSVSLSPSLSPLFTHLVEHVPDGGARLVDGGDDGVPHAGQLTQMLHDI